MGNNSNANLWLVRAMSNPYAAHGPGELSVKLRHSFHIDRRCTIQLYSMLFGLLGTARNTILPRPYRFKLECFESDANPILALIHEHCLRYRAPSLLQRLDGLHQGICRQFIRV